MRYRTPFADPLGYSFYPSGDAPDVATAALMQSCLGRETLLQRCLTIHSSIFPLHTKNTEERQLLERGIFGCLQ
ncbi:hypothetical protein BZZ01_19785 [Nostocales cyanobacterium HT-58-2]|nr:hypothetical protein BZZ01_19785 [Nostocales cyanobacterium HT-58-2]